MNENNPNEPDYGGFVPDGAGPEAEEGFYNLNELSAVYYAQPAPGARRRREAEARQEADCPDSRGRGRPRAGPRALPHLPQDGV